MRAALACFLVGSLVACGGGGGGGGGGKPKGPVGPAIDAKEAEQGASDLITEIYDTLGRGNKDSLFTLLDDSLIVFGPRSTDMLGTRADALVALGQVVDPRAKKTLEIGSGKLEVVAAPGGRSAWAFDIATINGQPHTVMAVLTNANDLWLVDAVAVARTPAAPQLKAQLAKDAVAPPGGAGTKKVDPDARSAIEKFQRGLLDQRAWGEELASRTDAVVIGPTAGEVTRGKKQIKALWKKRVDAKTRAAISGEITAAVTDDGQLAWVSAPITRVEGEGTQPLPLRAFAVYVQDGGEWRLIALHESLALGEPGSGAGFKKILPPRPVEPKPAEVIADKPKDKGKGKGKGETAKDRKAKAKKRARVKESKADDRDEQPKRRKKKRRTFAGSDDDGDDEPKKKAKADDDEPKKKKKKRRFVRADEDDDEQPKKKKKKKRTFARSDDEEDEQPKKKAKATAADEDQPKKKKKKPADDDDEIEIID